LKIVVNGIMHSVVGMGNHNLKEIKFSNEGRASILNGVDILANAVSVTQVIM
jgi:hypothetical protein